MAKLTLEHIELMLDDAKDMLKTLEAPGEIDASTAELIQLTKEQIAELEEMKAERTAE
ncbi:MAG: hypothetical protein KBT36_17825 [Kurthia sp.]|nr:hypothetical protein [Candidatus Kurthia equi]